MNTCLWCGEVKSIEHSHKQFWGEYNEIRLQLTMLCLACNNVWFKWTAPDPKCYWRKLELRYRENHNKRNQFHYQDITL